MFTLSSALKAGAGLGLEKLGRQLHSVLQNIELARRASEMLFTLQPEKSGTHVLLAKYICIEWNVGTRGKVLLIELSLPEKLQQFVTNHFSRVAQTGRCSFTGNGSLGSSVSLSELREIYDVVRLCFAESDRVLSIPGEDLSGIHLGGEFVWWYNGHPYYIHFALDLKSSDAAVRLFSFIINLHNDIQKHRKEL
ncbi:hypothetical protein RHMOL_Rhmol02G0270300 [Rhododendron molle]|uniref:Uncharacterized protein n=1 Tax=Rhododendron molle TaxID=49168 RepID=A0ACC0PVZ5_RHOML|nr:hypothetical protein RHMOL_Rhmol02G0270300 [Rhododendron molle]